MRGGEKCLDVLCRAFPDATLHTLIHKRGCLSPTIERMTIRTSPLQRVPGVFRHYRKLLPIMPLAANGWRVGEVDVVVSLSHCVAKAVRVPPGVPHVCYCFTPMRYAWDGRDAYLESWRDRPLRRAAAVALLDSAPGLGSADLGPASRTFVAISETVPRADRPLLRPREPRDSTPGRCRLLHARRLDPRRRLPGGLGARPLQAGRAGDRRLRAGGPAADDHRRRARTAAAGTARWSAERRFLGWQPDEVIREHYRRARALLFPGEEDFGIVPVEALATGCPVIALGRGALPRTSMIALGRTYSESTAEGLARTIEAWEAAGRPHDATRGPPQGRGAGVPGLPVAAARGISTRPLGRTRCDPRAPRHDRGRPASVPIKPAG